MKKVFLTWGYSAVIVALVCGIIYVAVQQNYRQNANDPQVEIAEDLATAMAAGAPPQNVGTPGFDLSQSLAPYVAVFDSTGKTLAYTATLNGNPPSLPSGVMDYAKTHGEDRFTWQPKAGVRHAVVLTYFADPTGKTTGYVMAGRSLREVELREGELEIEVGFGIFFTWLVSFLMLWICHLVKKRGASVPAASSFGSPVAPPRKFPSPPTASAKPAAMPPLPNQKPNNPTKTI